MVTYKVYEISKVRMKISEFIIMGDAFLLFIPGRVRHGVCQFTFSSDAEATLYQWAITESL